MSVESLNVTAISADQLRAIVGNIDDAIFIEILEMAPTIAEVEQAAVWAAGNGDVLSKEGRPLTDKVAKIIDILTADEEEPPPVR